MDFALLFVLLAVSFIGGSVTTAVGPGGIFVIAVLYVLTGLSEAEVAGTSSVAFILGSIIGGIAYVRSNEMNWRIALVIGITGAASTRLGIWANTLVSRQVFGILLAVLLASIGMVILVREQRGLDPVGAVGTRTGWQKEIASLSGIGIFIGTCSGLFGIGGAALTVPCLVLIDVSLLTALAVTQVVVVFLSLFTAAGYVAAGAVRSPLVIFIGGAYTGGCVVGWHMAHRIDTDQLTVTLGWSLIGLAPILAVQAVLL